MVHGDDDAGAIASAAAAAAAAAAAVADDDDDEMRVVVPCSHAAMRAASARCLHPSPTAPRRFVAVFRPCLLGDNSCSIA